MLRIILGKRVSFVNSSDISENPIEDPEFQDRFIDGEDKAT
jgi:hypothetical protein